MNEKTDEKVKIKVKRTVGLTPVKITIVSLGVFLLMISVGVAPELMGNSAVKDSYIIKYNSNGGVGKMKDQRISYGKNVQLNKNKYTNNGHMFNGWRVKMSNNTWMCYVDSQKVKFILTNQSYCNRYGYVLYKDNVYVNNLANPGDIVYLYADWK